MIIKYHRNLIITNIAQLPRGIGAPYLEVIRDDIHGVLIAAQWRRKLPKRPLGRGRYLVKFS